MKNKIAAIVFITCLFAMTGCSAPIESSTTTVQTIASKTLSALAKVKSFDLDTDITNTYKIIQNSTTDKTEWKSTKLINLSNQEMKMNMAITDNSSGTNSNDSMEMYFKNGYEYLKAIITGVYGTNSWIKRNFDITLWNRETQIPFLTEILKTATQFGSLDNEKLNGISCYVLTITPSAEASVDFIASQEQPYGPQIDEMWGGGTPVVRPDAYKNGSIKLWIGTDNYLPLKVEINADFQGNVGGGFIPATTIPYTPTTNPIDSSFQGQLDFSNYNQPVSIQLPQDAMNTQISGN